MKIARISVCRVPVSVFLVVVYFGFGSPSIILRRTKRQYEDEDKPEFKCPTPDGLYADPETCKKFYICSGFYPFSQNCPSSLYFDDVQKFCTRRSKKLVCGPVDTPSTVAPTPDTLAAPECDTSKCVLPDCFCSSDGTRIPGDLEPSETPQMILMSFDGGVNALNFDHYKKLLSKTRNNPNGCPIKGTFFVSHEYTSHFHVQKFYAEGHEIAVHSITKIMHDPWYRFGRVGRPTNWLEHNKPHPDPWYNMFRTKVQHGVVPCNRYPEDYWTTASYEDYAEEMVGQREILHMYANISRDHLLGMRVPFLHPGGNNMMSVAYDYDFVYDSSISVPMTKVPIWPYTLDYKIPHRCMKHACPTRSFPGLWEIPLNTLYSEDGTGGMCTLADQCVFQEHDDESVMQFLQDNFNRHYNGNRAPLGLYFHVNWFTDRNKTSTLLRFVDNILAQHKDVWFVTMQELISWMRQPTKSSSLNNYAPWACEKRENTCNLPNNCPVPLLLKEGYQEMRYMQTCRKCPVKYPWIGNFEGANEGHRIVDLTKDTEEDAKEDDAKR